MFNSIRNHLQITIRFTLLYVELKKSINISILQPDGEYRAGVDTVTTKFISGHLKNNVLQEKSFLYIERKANNSFSEGFLENIGSSIETEWETILTDTDLETTIKWCRTNHILGESIVEIKWSISNHTYPGVYRIRHVGYHKASLAVLFSFV